MLTLDVTAVTIHLRALLFASARAARCSCGSSTTTQSSAPCLD